MTRFGGLAVFALVMGLSGSGASANELAACQSGETAICSKLIRDGGTPRDVKAKAHLARGQIEAAVKASFAESDFTAALIFDPKLLDANFERARFFAASHQNEKALADLDQVLEKQPGNPRALSLRAAVRGELKLTRGMIDDLTALEAQTPLTLAQLQTRLLANTQFGFLDKAFADIDKIEAMRPKASDLDPVHAQLFAMRGQKMAEDRKPDRAIADLDLALALKPDLIWAHLPRGYAYLFRQDYDLALADFNVLLAADASDNSALAGKALVEFKTGKLDQFVEDFSVVAERDEKRAMEAAGLEPGMAAALIQQSDTLAGAGDLDKSFKAVDLAIKLAPKNSGTYLKRAALQEARQNGEAALADYSKAIELDPQGALALEKRALLHSKQGKFADALADFDSLIKVEPNSASNHFNRALTLVDLGRKADAIAVYGKVLELNPGEENAYYNRGLLHLQLGDNKPAIADFDRVIAINPKRDDAFGLRAIAHNAVGEKERAIADYMSVVFLDPANEKAFYQLGAAHLARHDYQLALGDYGRAAALNPGNKDAFFGLGAVRLGTNEPALALEEFDAALALDPNFIDAHLSRGDTLLLLKREADAVEAYTKALAIDGNSVDGFLGRARTLLKLKKPSDALADAEAAIKLAPDRADAFRTRGAIFEARKKIKLAISDYRKAVALGKDADSLKALKRLKAK